MGARPALVTQADISRAIRAVQAAGLPVLRVVVRGSDVVVETTPEPVRPGLAEIEQPADDGSDIVL